MEKSQNVRTKSAFTPYIINKLKIIILYFFLREKNNNLIPYCVIISIDNIQTN